MTWIVTWSHKGDHYWSQCYTLEDAERLYKAKAELNYSGAMEVSLCEVKRSTADWYQPN